MIHNPVVQLDRVGAQLCLDPPLQLQVLTKHRGLLDDTLTPQRALVTVPAFSVAREPSRNGPDPAMK